jgi:sialic acid synthase SpsE
MRKVFIGNKEIGSGQPPFLIAEIGCNFEGSFETAKRMVVAAAKSGADAVKFQTFIPEKLVTKSAPKFWEIEGCPGETQYDEFKTMYRLNFEQYKEIVEIGLKYGCLFLSTPFDEGSADLLEKLNVPAYKIASMDITHLPLLRHVAKKEKPIVLSTGASTIDEINEAVAAIEGVGNEDIVLLHCITNYPTDDANVNLGMINGIRRVFPDIPIGYSDHTIEDPSHCVLAAAFALGACVIEKHFTLDKARPGYDHVISADPKDLAEIVSMLNRVWHVLGKEDKMPTESEEKIKKLARRSLVSEVDIKEGEVIQEHMLSVKRPGYGVPPKELNKVVGMKALVDISADTVIERKMLSHEI